VLPDDQVRYDRVLADLLSEALSLGRAAQLLGTSYVDLRARVDRLGLSTRQGPTTPEEAQEDARVAMELWSGDQ
jgi:hypothetical protein